MTSIYGVDIVWPCPTKEVRDQVIEFWRAEGALHDPERARQRAQELIVVGRTLDQKVAAVSTARRVVVQQLDLKCFYYRMFVGGSYRTAGIRSTDLVRSILLESYRTLNERFQRGYDPEFVGIYMEIENESVKRHRNQTVWTDFGANVVYIGKTSKGHHARVWYFDDSRI